MMWSGVLALALQAAPAGAVPPKAPPAAQPSDVIVEARAQSTIDRFVDQMTQQLRGRQIARWNGHICPKVLGLDPAQAGLLIDHLAAIARPLHIPVDRRHCSADVVIVVTNDADGFTRGFIKDYPRLFQDTSSGVAFLPAITAALLKPRPVRWLNASSTGMSGGGNFSDANYIYDASRLKEPVRENAVLSLAIVDAKQMAHVNWGQLGDYLAMVTLARPDMATRYDGRSILALFADRDAGKPMPQRIADLDKDFLRGLYGTEGAVKADQQRTQIKNAIEHPRR